MKKKLVGTLLVLAMTGSILVGGCGKSDQEAAQEVADKIDAIYVQERTEKTDEQCKEAKEAWDQLTEAQKKLVEGENADPEYFGRDTGDASKDDPRNQDGIGKNEILVVSFGTSFNDSRVKDIKGIEDAMQKAYPKWSVRRAFTSQIIINHVQARDGEAIDNVEQALERAVKNGVENLIVQPTHLMHGAEYDELVKTLDSYQDKFAVVSVAEPLLGEVGNDATVINEDKEAAAKAVVETALKEAGFEDAKAAQDEKTAIVFLGHGTSHAAKVSYTQMQTQMEQLGLENMWIGTVEGEPEETACEEIIKKVSELGYEHVILRPLMVVAGDHANNDMAGEAEDSWASQMKESGKFESVECQIAGLGEIADIQKLYIAHTKEAMQASMLEDGIYSAEFQTDSGMFHVNDACKGKGKLTVKNGEMTIHITLTSKKILNLFPGLAEDAKKEGAELLQPTTDTVTYEDGTTEEVYGFDVPVPALDQEFDLALIGTKGKWYDHKVSVSNPVKEEVSLADGTYEMELDFEGGSGKAKIQSPAVVVVKDGKVTAKVEWSSPNYDYMIVQGEKYLPINTEGNSIFEIPVSVFDQPMDIIGDTVAMSEPHEISYKITFYSDTKKERK